MITTTSADHDKAFEIIRDVQLIDLTYRDAQFVRGELADAIAQAIAAAVQAEREACAKITEEESLHNPLVSDEWLKSSNDRDEQVAFTHADRIAAAIRARSEAKS